MSVRLLLAGWLHPALKKRSDGLETAVAWILGDDGDYAFISTIAVRSTVMNDFKHIHDGLFRRRYRSR